MHIGVFIESHDPSAGGAYAYTTAFCRRIIEVKSSHRFSFIIKTPENIIPDGFSFLPNVILYSGLDRSAIPSPSLFGKIERFVRNIFRISIASERLVFTKTVITKSNNRFKQIVKNANIDLVYYPMPFICEDPEIPFAATIWDIGHLTVPFFPEISGNGGYHVRKRFTSDILPRAALVVAESNAGRIQLIELCNTNPDRTIVLPQFPGNVVRCSVSQEESDLRIKKLGISAKPFILYPAQFWPHKNHITLLKAIGQLRDYGIDINLVLTGSDQGNLEHVKEFAEVHDLTNNIFFLGFVDDETLYSLYKYSLALVFPSLLGPTNMPIIEALAVGCPIICTDFDGHKEQAGEGAIYINPIDYKEIADRIKDLFENTKMRDTLIENGRLHFLKNQHANIFENLLSALTDFEHIRSNWK